jgi:hypothetical protein
MLINFGFCQGYSARSILFACLFPTSRFGIKVCGVILPAHSRIVVCNSLDSILRNHESVSLAVACAGE